MALPVATSYTDLYAMSRKANIAVWSNIQRLLFYAAPESMQCNFAPSL